MAQLGMHQLLISAFLLYYYGNKKREAYNPLVYTCKNVIWKSVTVLLFFLLFLPCLFLVLITVLFFLGLSVFHILTVLKTEATVRK